MRVRVLDETGKPAGAIVSVDRGSYEPEHDPYAIFSLRRSGNRHKGPIRFRPLDYYFYTDGVFEVRVPAGTHRLEFRKGYEYSPKIVEVTAGKRQTINIEARLERWIDMMSLGWCSGDTHIHMNRSGSNDDTLLTVTSAKDIRCAFILSMNTGGYDRGRKYEEWPQAKGLGDAGEYSRGGYWLSSGQEYRVESLGHVTIILPDEYVPGVGPTEDVNLGPSLGVIADQAHSLRGFIGLAHGGYTDQEADGLLLNGKMDFLELLQFGGYRSLELDGWYDFLNLGYRLPIVGACDFPYTRELGSEITYVRCDNPPTPREWAGAAAAGRSFATSGPMLFFEMGKLGPGDRLSLPEGADTLLDVQVRVRSPLYPVRFVELIVNGNVVAREMTEGRSASLDLQYRLRVNESAWIAARTYAEAGAEAHTNPLYVYVGGKLPFSRASARHVLARLEGSIEYHKEPRGAGPPGESPRGPAHAAGKWKKWRFPGPSARDGRQSKLTRIIH